MSEYDQIALYYDLQFADVDADIPFYNQFALRTGDPLLELGCGTGRVTLALGELGHTITGVDISSGMLAHAREKLAEHPDLAGKVSFVQADMRTLQLDRQYSMAFVAINSFMHMLTQRDQLQSLQAIRRNLRAGGLLILDLFNPDQGLLAESDGRVELRGTYDDPESEGSVIVFESRRHDAAHQLLHLTYLYDQVDPEGRMRRTFTQMTLHYFMLAEIELLLRAGGFALEQVYGSYELDPFEDGSEKMIVVATRSE